MTCEGCKNLLSRKKANGIYLIHFLYKNETRSKIFQLCMLLMPKKSVDGSMRTQEQGI